jgi:hypoxanthine-guanine phosphoribosyltransferase
MKQLNFKIDCEFIKVSSYQGMKSTGIVKLESGPQM